MCHGIIFFNDFVILMYVRCIQLLTASLEHAEYGVYNYFDIQ